MHFGFTSDQLELRAGLREFLDDACPPEVVRAAWQAEQSPIPGLWKKLGGVGLLGLLVSEEAGGIGRTEVDLVALFEECGRFAVPGPLAEHIAVVVPALTAAGAPEADRALAGDLVATAAERTAATVRWVVGTDLLVQVGDDGLSLTQRADMRISEPRISVDGSVTAAAVEALKSAELPGCAPEVARRRAALAVSAQLLGVADRMIAMTAEHVKRRRQFGVPIGSQQSVKHLLATALVALEHARPVVYRAGWVLATNTEAPDLAVSFAKVYATRAAETAARTALQCHGAIGYSWEHDLHLWMKRVWALSTAWGTAATHEERVAAQVVDA